MLSKAKDLNFSLCVAVIPGLTRNPVFFTLDSRFLGNDKLPF